MLIERVNSELNVTEADTFRQLSPGRKARGRQAGPCPISVFKERVCRIGGERFRSNADLIFAVGCGAQARNKGHLVDALALRGDEGRGTLRKARGRCEQSLIPGSPNGATHPQGYRYLNS